MILLTTFTDNSQKQISEIYIRSHSGRLTIYFEENRMNGLKYDADDGFVEKTFVDGEIDQYRKYIIVFPAAPKVEWRLLRAQRSDIPMIGTTLRK